LDHRAHRPIQNQNSSLKLLPQFTGRLHSAPALTKNASPEGRGEKRISRSSSRASPVADICRIWHLPPGGGCRDFYGPVPLPLSMSLFSCRAGVYSAGCRLSSVGGGNDKW